MLIRSGEAPAIGWSRDMLYSGFITLPRSVIRRQTLFAARITRTLSDADPTEDRPIKRYSLLAMLIAVAVIAFPVACFTFVHVEIKAKVKDFSTAESYVVFDKGGPGRASSALPWTTVKRYDSELGTAVIRTQRITAWFLDYDHTYGIQQWRNLPWEH